jgi:hypothetical protein
VDVFEILQIGAIGLGLSLAVLGYRLLARGANPTPVYFFLLFSMVLVTIGASSRYFNNPELSQLQRRLDSMSAINDQLSYELRNSEAARAAQGEAIQGVLTAVDSVLARLNDLDGLAANDSCPGGASGVPSNHAADISRVNQEIIAKVSSLRSDLVPLAPSVTTK